MLYYELYILKYKIKIYSECVFNRAPTDEERGEGASMLGEEEERGRRGADGRRKRWRKESKGK